MDMFFWMILIASLAILITLIISLYTDDSEGIKIGVVITSFIIFLSIIGLLVEKPTAIDVYQNKTTLKYTIIDGNKIDNTVVWKRNFNN